MIPGTAFFQTLRCPFLFRVNVKRHAIAGTGPGRYPGTGLRPAAGQYRSSRIENRTKRSIFIMKSPLSVTLDFGRLLDPGINIAVQSFSPAVTAFFTRGEFLDSMPWYFLIISFGLHPRYGVRLATLFGLNVGLNEAVKLAGHMPRPYWVSAGVEAFSSHSSFGFPSGAAMYGATWLLSSAASCSLSQASCGFSAASIFFSMLSEDESWAFSSWPSSCSQRQRLRNAWPGSHDQPASRPV